MHKNVLAIAVAVALGATAFTVHAVDLSPQMDVQSRPGKPFRAVVRLVDVPDPLTFDEIDVRNASPASYADAGLEYTEFAGTLRVTKTAPDKKTGERRVVVTSSKAPVGSPTILLDVSWSGGRAQRDFVLTGTGGRQAPVEEVLTAQPKPRAVESTNTPKPASQPSPMAQAADSVSDMPSPVVNGRSRRDAQPSNNLKVADGQDLVVPKGATASGLAAQNKPRDVRLESYLAGMLLMNDQAFVGQNINKLRAGALMRVPTRAQAQALTAQESRDILSGVSVDNFNAYRARLAGLVPQNDQVAQSTSQSGKLNKAQGVNESATPPQDRLALSKAAIDAKTLASRQVKETSEQIARLEAQLAELRKASAMAGSVAAASKAEPALTAAPGVVGKEQVSANESGKSPSSSATTPAVAQAQSVKSTIKNEPQVEIALKAEPVLSQPGANAAAGGGVAATAGATGSAGGAAQLIPSPALKAPELAMQIPGLPEVPEEPPAPKTLVERLMTDPADVFVQAMSSLYGMVAAGVLALLALLALVASGRRKKANRFQVEDGQSAADDGSAMDDGLVFAGDVDVKDSPRAASSQQDSEFGNMRDDPVFQAAGGMDSSSDGGADMSLDGFDLGRVEDVEPRAKPPKKKFFQLFNRAR